MGRLSRIYNQNWKQIWIIALIIVFIIAIIQILNSAAKNMSRVEGNQTTTENTSQTENERTYEKESKSLVSGEELTGSNKETFGKLIDEFIDNCVNEKYDEAYKMLSEDCKNELYPSKEIFVEQYCKSRFEKGKTYDFQLWSSGGAYIYLVKIYDNMLSTGRLSNATYTQDYYSIVQSGQENKINVNGYLGRVERGKETTQDNIKITVDYSNVYMDYEIYSITIQNNGEKDILLDTREETDSVYITDENGYNYEAFMYELLDDDLVIKAGEEKDITIKFSNNYNDGVDMREIVFSKIAKDYKAYTSNNFYNDYLEISIEL